MAEQSYEDDDRHLTPVQRRRLLDREEWKAYWQVRSLDANGGFFPSLIYYCHRAADMPVTWFREKIIEPLHDKYKMPYYQRRLTRVPDIDLCGVNDQVCRSSYF